LIIKNTLLSNELFGSLNPKGWPFTIADLPEGSALVGGSIRDGLLKRLSKKPDLDFVIPTSAIEFGQNLSKKINATFVKLDEKRDIVRLVINGWSFDFATQIGENLKDDLSRRDYTINAIALKLKKQTEIYDPTGGIDDLKSQKIVAISEKNLIDDPLRILRGFRLMCELNFDLEQKTKSLLKNNANQLDNVAPERIKIEIMKIINSEWNDSVLKNYSELLLLEKWHEDSISYFEKEGKDILSKNLLFGRPLAKLICLLSNEGLLRFTFSKNTIKKCKNLRFWVRKINKVGLGGLSDDERFQLHLDLEEDLLSLMLFLNDEYLNEWLERWKDPSDPLFHPSSPFNGNELQRVLGIAPGPCLGQLMKHLAKKKALGHFFTKEEALQVARKWKLENYPLL
tara:strand:- start:204 stop:1397 length:1194 start_codon:yes stop_codon:yes gene_type:complete